MIAQKKQEVVVAETVAVKKKKERKRQKSVGLLSAKKPRGKNTKKKVFERVGAEGFEDCRIISSPRTLAPEPSDVATFTLPLLDELDEFLKSPEYEKPPELVLAYTYFLKDTCKYVSVGFSTPDIVPVIVIHHINECSITLSSAEWFSLFLYIAEIEDMFDKSLFMESKYLSDATSLVHDVSLGQMILIKDKVLLRLTKSDWSTIVHMSGFFRSVINFCTHSASAVKCYYDTYFIICLENNFKYLEHAHFFLQGNNYKPLFNCTRLFHEIGFICKKKNAHEKL